MLIVHEEITMLEYGLQATTEHNTHNASYDHNAPRHGLIKLGDHEMSLPLQTADNGIIHNSSYNRNWTLIFSQGGVPPDGGMAGVQHFIDLMDWYYTPTISGFGLIINTLVLVTSRHSQLAAMSVTPFLAALAVVDSAYLVALLLSWMDQTHDIPVMNIRAACQLVKFLLFSANFLSIWYVICVQVDRYMAMWHISRRPERAPTRRATFLACAIGLLGLLLYSVILWTAGVDTDALGTTTCVFLSSYYDILKIFSQANTLLASLMPYSMLPVLNLLVLIQVCVRCASLRRADHPDVGPSSGMRHHDFQMEGVPPSPMLDGDPFPRESYVDSRGYMGRARAQVRTTTAFLVVTSIVWLLNVPSQAMRIAEFFRWGDPSRPATGSASAAAARTHMYVQLYSFLHTASFALKGMFYLTFSALWRDAVLDCCRYCSCACSCSDEETLYEIREQVSPLPPSPGPSPLSSPIHDHVQETISQV